MAEQHDKRTGIWWLSGVLAILGIGIAVFASMEYFIATLIAVGLSVVVTVLIGMVLAQADK